MTYGPNSQPQNRRLTALTRLKVWAKKSDVLFISVKTLKWLIQYGPRKAGLFVRCFLAELARFRAVIKQRPARAQLKAQREAAFERSVKVSLLAALHEPDAARLDEMIRSVREQTYANWQLCLADAGGSAEAVCLRHAREDGRICYERLDGCVGASEALDACERMAQGEYLALVGQEDALHPSALYAVVKAINERGADLVYTDECAFEASPREVRAAHYKPDYAPDMLRSYNYIGRLTAFSRELLERAGGLLPDAALAGALDYDLALRLTERAAAIAHVPSALYYRRAGEDREDEAAARTALENHLRRVGLEGEVEPSGVPGAWRIRYRIERQDLVSIIIPNKDHIDDLEKCVTSIREKTTYPRWEIVIVENNSTEDGTFRYYQELEKDERIRVVRYEGPFNYSAINNFGARHATGEYLLLLNNDTEIITPDWIEQMLMYAQREDVGAVGAMLYYPDDTVQHAGVILGVGGIAGHVHRYLPRGDAGYMRRAAVAQDLTIVTAACMMIPWRAWRAVNGLDESFAVAFNDVDLCVRIRRAGFLIVWTPYAELYHYEYKSRGHDDTRAKRKVYAWEIYHFKETWAEELNRGDPYYNPNLTMVREDYSARDIITEGE